MGTDRSRYDETFPFFSRSMCQGVQAARRDRRHPSEQPVQTAAYAILADAEPDRAALPDLRMRIAFLRCPKY